MAPLNRCPVARLTVTLFKINKIQLSKHLASNSSLYCVDIMPTVRLSQAVNHSLTVREIMRSFLLACRSREIYNKSTERAQTRPTPRPKCQQKVMRDSNLN